MNVAHQCSGNVQDVEYSVYLERIKARYLNNVNEHGPVFRTDSGGLWDRYLLLFPEYQRQYHNCNACRHFIERFGGLVVVDSVGRTIPAVWDDGDAPELYLKPVQALIQIVKKAKIVSPFYSGDVTLGMPRTGEWTHLSINQRREDVFRLRTLTAGQYMAQKMEDYQTLNRAIADFPVGTVQTALNILQSDAVYRAEKVIGPVKWFYELLVKRAASNLWNNLTWKAVATAPDGFCHIRSSMAGTLLEDIQAGLGVDVAVKRFADKMHPLRYQRPQAAPTTGNIKRAEEVVAKLGIEKALRRRFARIDEVHALWRPTEGAPEKTEGVFGHLKPKGVKPQPELKAPESRITWEKFLAKVLPGAKSIRIQVGSPASWCVITTAADPEAPPILQWDLEEARCPFSLYFWHGGARPSQFGVDQGLNEVEAISLRPSQWNEGYQGDHHGDTVIFYVKGAKETRVAGLALFPENLKGELREIRSTVEAFSRAGVLEGREDATACGLGFSRGRDNWGCHVEVLGDLGWTKYHIDRWE